ncbi:hypothetical protein ACFIJ5_10905 [Haloimpatiens sp. FM7330]|uniref:hypothetical protein n=1 Tax=Haloimpatiens sp. FM7330 TaxID=3298610 RepID=UPI00363DB3BC
MAKILGVKILYPEGVDVEEAHLELQERAMNILAKSLVKRLPSEAIQEIINRLEKLESLENL